MDKYAIVLAGGGAKGIYEIGAWKALSELGIVYEAVAGTSIGAINAAFMVQGDHQKAYDMWFNLKMEQCVHLPEHMELSSDNLMDRQHAGILIKELLTRGGIDQTPLYDLLQKHIDVQGIYSSPIDFGLCMYSVKDRTCVKLWRKDIPQDQFFSYLLASAAFPGLRQVKLDNQVYMDGGLGDNLPFDMLRNRGIRNIIAIDLRIVKEHNINTDRLRITHICNSLDLGAPLDLSPAILSRNFELGYLDTKKTFGFYDGIHYYLPLIDYQNLLSFWGDDTVVGLEQAALIYDMPRDRVYSATEFIDTLKICRQKATLQYAHERQKFDVDGIITSLRDGTLKRLKNMPSTVRLPLLMELTADVKSNGSKWSIPLKFFKDVDLAAESLLKLQ